MQYNTGLQYDNAGINYIGSLVINVSGISNPIILNNIKISFAGSQDYSNLTTVAVLSIDVNPSGVIIIETVKENLSALTSVEAITIYDGNVIGLG